MGIKTITGLIPIHLHLQKLSRRLQLRICLLPSNHAIKFLIEKRHAGNFLSYLLSLENMTSKQWSKIKSLVTNTNICLNRIFSSFDFLNSEISLRSILIDIFPSHFSFYKADCQNKESKAACLHKLDDLVLNVLFDLHTVIVISNASIRNNIATSITHIYLFFSSTKKTLHYTVDITITEAELFTIRCGINQAVWIPDFSHIIVITDTLHVV